jgi:hypothetical protein
VLADGVRHEQAEQLKILLGEIGLVGRGRGCVSGGLDDYAGRAAFAAPP